MPILPRRHESAHHPRFIHRHYRPRSHLGGTHCAPTRDARACQAVRQVAGWSCRRGIAVA